MPSDKACMGAPNYLWVFFAYFLSKQQTGEAILALPVSAATAFQAVLVHMSLFS